MMTQQSKKQSHQEKKAMLFKLILFPLSKLQASFQFHPPPPNSLISIQPPKNIIPMYMETPNQYRFSLFSSIIVVSAVVSFALCIAAEFKKSKKDDLMLDGKLCYLPTSAAFKLGIAALICLSITQVAGTLFICRKFCSREQGSTCSVSRSLLLLLSWMCFGVAVILLSAASSMNQRQAFGEGWLDGECYLVKDGVFVGSALLTLLALGSTLGSGIIPVRRKKAEENTRVLSSCKS